MLLNYRMRFYLILFFCVSLIFTSCKDDRKIPADIIPEHAMAELLTDIHIVDGSLYEVSQMPDTLAKHGLATYMAVFKANHTDTTQFKKSLKFYTTRPEILIEIYNGIGRRLQKKIDSLQKIKPKVNKDSVKMAAFKQKRLDSLKNVKVKATADSLKKVKAKAKKDSLKKVKPKHKKLKKHKLIKPNAVS